MKTNGTVSGKTPCHLIYDWNCELCVNLMKFIKALDRGNDIVFVSYDHALARELAGNLSEEALAGNFHFVLPTGALYSGDEAIPHVIGALPGGKIPQWLLQHMPGRRFLLKAFYRCIVKMREFQTK
jgi:predicted DCC family thiol-disulfide oxidoreductase YuxK